MTALIVALLAAASGYLFLPKRAATLVVLACIGVLSTAGVVALFAAAAGVLGWKAAPGLPATSGDPAQAFVENMVEGVLMTAADGTPLWANAAFLKLSGAANERDLHSIERLFSGNPDAAEAVHRLAVAAERGRRATEEIRMPGGIGGTASGARWYRVRVSPAGGSEARIGWLVGDITREREHQENIFQELQNAIDYLDHAPAGFFSLEPDGRIRYLNATLAEWIGIDLAEFEPGAANIRDIVTVEGLSVIQAASPAPAAKRRRSTSTSCAPTERGCRSGSSIACRSAPTARSAPRARWSSTCSGGDDREAGPHRRDALRPLLQQHADGDRLGRPRRADRAHQRPLRDAVRQGRAPAGAPLAELVQESRPRRARGGDQRGDRAAERDPGGRRRRSPTSRSEACASS